MSVHETTAPARRRALRGPASLLMAVVLLAMGLGGAAPAEAQEQQDPNALYIPPQKICVLKKAPFRGKRRVPPPVPVREGPEEEDGSATFQINFFGGWPQDAKNALEYSAGIWGDLLDSLSPIVVIANWDTLSGGTLGQAGPRTYRSDFNRAPQDNVFYPIAMANAIAGEDLNGGQAEINLTLDSTTDWYFRPDGNVPVNKYDLITVALHELAHGLGFTGTANVNVAGLGSWGFNINGDQVPLTYDTFVEDSDDTLMINESVYPNPSTELGDLLTAGSPINFGVFFGGPTSNEYKLYTPFNWQPGSSYSHFSDSSELMSPATAPGVSIQDPGHALNLLMDSGWADALPVELAGFSGAADGSDVVLHWRTLSETRNDHFRILQKEGGAFTQIGTEPSQVEGGTTNEPQDYSFRITGVAPGRHVFRLQQVDIDGTRHPGDDATVEVSLREAFHLSSAYPNPFRSRTRLDLTVKERQEVRVGVYDALGRQVAVPFKGVLHANEPKTLTLASRDLASGLYLVRVRGEDFSETRTVTLVQ